MPTRPVLVLVLLLFLLARAILALSLAPALDTVVLVTATFTVRDSAGQVHVYVSQGSGWTSACRPGGDRYQIVVQTAAHVVDPGQNLRLLALDKSCALVGVAYRLDYRDGSRYRLGGGAYRRGSEDSARLEFASRLPRLALPVGDPGLVGPGDRLFTLACPEGLRFLAGDGVFSATIAEAGLAHTLPPEWRGNWWLSTLPAMPGSSGAPVLSEKGQVVAQIVGRLEWPGGTFSILMPRGVK